MKITVRPNVWDNWYGYIGGRRVIAFANSTIETAEQQAQRWLHEQHVLVGNPRFTVRTCDSMFRATQRPHQVIDNVDPQQPRIVDEYHSKRAALMDAAERNKIVHMLASSKFQSELLR